MKKKTFLIILLTLCQCGLIAMHAQETERREAEESRVYFRAGKSEIDLSFRRNGEVLADFVAGVEGAMRESGVLVESIVIESGASPEGRPEVNERLALNRARSVRDYLMTVLPLSSKQFKVWSRGIDWEELIRIVDSSDVKWKDDILSAIRESGVLSSSDYTRQNDCLERLRTIDGGAAWRWLMDGPFNELRLGVSRLNCIVSHIGNAGESRRDTLVIIHEYEGPDAEWYLNEASARAGEIATRNVLDALEKKPAKRSNEQYLRENLIAFRTNLLAPALNVGVELPLSNRWSISLDYYYPWIWRDWMDFFLPARSYCLELMALSLEPRYWFGAEHRNRDDYRKYRLTGHSLGVVLQAGYYDLEYDWKGVQGEYASAGLSYMWSVSPGKSRVRFEFEVAAGVVYTGWRGYEVLKEGGKLIGNWKDGLGFYPSPLRASVNVVVPIYAREKKVVVEE